MKKIKNIWEEIKIFCSKIKDITGILCNLATVITLVVTVCALREDIRTRNSEYMPLIKAETLDEEKLFKITWNINLNSQSEDIPELHLKLYNIGNGNANNIVIKFNREVLMSWIEALQEMEPEGVYTYADNENDFIFYYPYILTGPENEVIIDIPSNYFECLTELYRVKEMSGTGPIQLAALEFEVTYQDIQEKSITTKYIYNNWFNENAFSMSSNGERTIVISNQIQAEEK